MGKQGFINGVIFGFIFIVIISFSGFCSSSSGVFSGDCGTFFNFFADTFYPLYLDIFWEINHLIQSILPNITYSKYISWGLIIFCFGIIGGLISKK